MSRRYHDQVEVRMGRAREHRVQVEGALSSPSVATGDEPEVPTLFLWRGRLHLVQAVLAQWSQRVPWWRAVEGDGEQEGSWPGLERVVWRVEAAAGRSGGTGVYDLVQAEQWWLERVSD